MRFYPLLWGEVSHTRIVSTEKVGTLLLSSLLQDLDFVLGVFLIGKCWIEIDGFHWFRLVL